MMQSHAALEQAQLDTLWRPLTQHALKQPPLVIVEGRGCMVVDADRKEYIDGMAGLWCVNVGHGQQRLIDAATRQLQQISYTPLTRPAPSAVELASRLAEKLRTPESCCLRQQRVRSG